MKLQVNYYFLLHVQTDTGNRKLIVPRHMTRGAKAVQKVYPRSQTSTLATSITMDLTEQKNEKKRGI